MALSLPADIPQRALLQEITFGVVLFTLLIQGTTIGWVVDHTVRRDTARGRRVAALTRRPATLIAASSGADRRRAEDPPDGVLVGRLVEHPVPAVGQLDHAWLGAFLAVVAAADVQDQPRVALPRHAVAGRRREDPALDRLVLPAHVVHPPGGFAGSDAEHLGRVNGDVWNGPSCAIRTPASAVNVSPSVDVADARWLSASSPDRIGCGIRMEVESIADRGRRVVRDDHAPWRAVEPRAAVEPDPRLRLPRQSIDRSGRQDDAGPRFRRLPLEIHAPAAALGRGDRNDIRAHHADGGVRSNGSSRSPGSTSQDRPIAGDGAPDHAAGRRVVAAGPTSVKYIR